MCTSPPPKIAKDKSNLLPLLRNKNLVSLLIPLLPATYTNILTAYHLPWSCKRCLILTLVLKIMFPKFGSSLQSLGKLFESLHFQTPAL